MVCLCHIWDETTCLGRGVTACVGKTKSFRWIGIQQLTPAGPCSLVGRAERGCLALAKLKHTDSFGILAPSGRPCCRIILLEFCCYELMAGLKRESQPEPDCSI